jgi:hypothetical protein
MWDVAVIDGTDEPSAGYLGRLHDWTRSRPFGEEHRVRLLRVGLAADGAVFTAAGYKLAHARQLLWTKFCAWSSYEYLLSLALDVGLPAGAMQLMYEAGHPWAVAFTDAAARPLRHSLLSGDLVRCVPFGMALDSDLAYVHACAAQSVYPALVPVT